MNINNSRCEIKSKKNKMMATKLINSVICSNNYSLRSRCINSRWIKSINNNN